MQAIIETRRYALSQVAQMLKVSRPLILRMAKNGELPCLRTPQGLRVEASALETWIESLRVPPASLAKSLLRK